MFAQRFATEQGSIEAIDTAAHLGPGALLEKYGNLERVTWAGEGAGQQLELLITWARDKGFPLVESGHNGSGWTIISETTPLANAVASLALKEQEAGRSLSAEELQAVYVRASDAEINERWQQQKAEA